MLKTYLCTFGTEKPRASDRILVISLAGIGFGSLANNTDDG